MSDSIEVSDLLLALYRASRELPVDQFQDAVLELLRPSIAFDSAQWGSGPHKTDWISKRQVHLYREPDDAAEIYEEVKDQDDAVKLAWRKKRGVLNYNIADLMTGKSRLGIRDYAKRVEHANVMLSFDIHPTTAFTKWISLYRARRSDYFTERDSSLVDLFTPHLWEALAVNRVTHLEHLGDKGADRKFELGICDLDGHIFHAELGFHAFLRDELGPGFTLHLPHRVMCDLLQVGRFVGHSIVVKVAQRKGVLFLKARAKQKADQLSSRELQIAKEVASGRSHKQIAQSLSIAPATVRNHIQAIHHKLGVHRIAELVEEVKRSL